MVWWEICGTRHNELDGMRTSNSPPPPAKVNSDCIGKNYLLSSIIITIVKIMPFYIVIESRQRHSKCFAVAKKHDRSSMHYSDL